jgi:hypothetical protein
MDDPLHAHAHFMWNELRPQGVWYRNFYNEGRTDRLAGTASVMTGVLTGIANGHQQFEYPTWVQHWLTYHEEDPATVVEVSRTDDTALSHGSHPRWAAADLGATYESALPSDTLAANRFIEHLRERRPRVAILVLNDASFAAEENEPPTPAYIRSVEIADSLLAAVVDAIAGMPDYAAETAIFITDHHGRHDEAHGGISGHGDSCAGCRNITFLALGPDFPPGRVVDTEATQVDLAQTCAALLRAPLPYGQGAVMDELFADGTAPPRAEHPTRRDNTAPVPANRFLHTSPSASCWPDVIIENGRLHIAWSEKRAVAPNGGHWDILSRYSIDDGASFAPVDTIAAAGHEFRPLRCALAADQDGYNGCVYGISAQRFRPFPHDSSWVWTLAIASRPEARSRIDGPFEAGEFAYVADRPAITARSSQILVAASTGGPRRITLDAARPDSLQPFLMTVYRSDYPATQHQFSDPTAMTLDENGSVAFGALISPVRTILHSTRWHPTTHRWATFVPLLEEEWQAVHPTATTDPLRDRRHLFWQDARAGSGFAIYTSRSDGLNGTWLPAISIGDQLLNAWNPHASARNGTVVVVVEEVSNGASRILMVVSRDAGLSWDPPVEIAAGGACSLVSHPRVALTEEGSVAHIVWQDNRNGEWNILYRRYSL